MKTKSPGPASTTCSRRSPHRYLAVPSSTYRIVSWSPWWCAPVAAPGNTVLRKALSTLASGLRLSKATSRSSPGLCGVSSESWSRRTTRTGGLFIVVSFLSLADRLSADPGHVQPERWRVADATGGLGLPALTSCAGSEQGPGPHVGGGSDVALRAAVDAPFRSSDLAREGRDEICDDLCDVVGLAHSASEQWSDFGHHAGDRGFLVGSPHLGGLVA